MRATALTAAAVVATLRPRLDGALHSSHFAGPDCPQRIGRKRSCGDRASRSVVRRLRSLARRRCAPGFRARSSLERAHQDRRRKRRPDEHQLLKQAALDRAESAKQREQKRNWEDRRHLGGPFGDKPSRLFASVVGNAGRRASVPARTDRAQRKFVTTRVSDAWRASDARDLRLGQRRMSTLR